MASEDVLIVAQEDGICELTLNRPQQRNALSSLLADRLESAFEKAASEARVIIITARGPAFCAGADLKERAGLSGVESRVHNRRLFAALEKVARCPIPVIAAVNGAAMGGGFELALAADLRVADPAARFGLPEVTLGIIPGAGGTQRLFNAVGGGWARALMLSGQPIDAETALRAGLVQEISAPGAVVEMAREWGRAIAKNAPLAVRALKEMIVAREETALQQGFMLERETIFRLFLTEDRDEGLRAFGERRAPEYRGK